MQYLLNIDTVGVSRPVNGTERSTERQETSNPILLRRVASFVKHDKAAKCRSDVSGCIMYVATVPIWISDKQ